MGPFMVCKLFKKHSHQISLYVARVGVGPNGGCKMGVTISCRETLREWGWHSNPVKGAGQGLPAPHLHEEMCWV